MVELLEKCVRFPWKTVEDLAQLGADKTLKEINVVLEKDLGFLPIFRQKPKNALAMQSIALPVIVYMMHTSYFKKRKLENPWYDVLTAQERRAILDYYNLN